MSIFGTIMNKIFHHPSAAAPAPAAPQPAPASPAGGGTATLAPAPAPTTAPAQKVDVGAVLGKIAATKGGVVPDSLRN